MVNSFREKANRVYSWTKERLSPAKIKESVESRFEEGYESFRTALEIGDSIFGENADIQIIRDELSQALNKELNSPVGDGKSTNLKTVVEGIKVLNDLERVSDRQSFSITKSQLQALSESLPKQFDLSDPRLKLARNNFAVEFISSNIVELGIVDVIGGGSALVFDLPDNWETILFGAAAWSAQPLPLPSIAGVFRSLVHMTYSKYMINRFNSKEDKGGKRSYMPRLIADGLTIFEWFGITWLPILNIVDAYGIPLNFKTIYTIYKLRKIQKALLINNNS